MIPRRTISEHQLDEPFGGAEWVMLLFLIGAGGLVAFLFDLI